MTSSSVFDFSISAIGLFSCDNKCYDGGCFGKFGSCTGVCYCYGVCPYSISLLSVLPIFWPKTAVCFEKVNVSFMTTAKMLLYGNIAMSVRK